MTPAKSNSRFTRFAKGTAYATGRPVAFAVPLANRVNQELDLAGVMAIPREISFIEG